MDSRSRTILSTLILAATLGCLGPGQASSRNEEREAQSGKPTRIFNFFDCTSHIPWQGTAFVDHGTVTYKDVTQKRCGNPSEPAREVWYTSPPGFTGVDTVTFPFSGGASTIFTITVH